MGPCKQCALYVGMQIHTSDNTIMMQNGRKYIRFEIPGITEVIVNVRCARSISKNLRVINCLLIVEEQRMENKYVEIEQIMFDAAWILC